MNLENYQKEAKRTLPNLKFETLSERHNESLNNIHMILGMQTEIAELTDVFKKHIAYNKPIDWVNVEEELADILWYLVNFATINNLSIEKSLINNINKLKIRFPDKFDEEKAINRNTTLERIELEKNG